MYDEDLLAPVKLLDCRVVCILVRHEESPPGCASVGIEPLLVEQPVVQQDVVDIDGPVEGEGHHLGDAGDLELSVSHPRGLQTEQTRRSILGSDGMMTN